MLASAPEAPEIAILRTLSHGNSTGLIQTPLWLYLHACFFQLRAELGIGVSGDL